MLHVFVNFVSCVDQNKTNTITKCGIISRITPNIHVLLLKLFIKASLSVFMENDMYSMK